MTPSTPEAAALIAAHIEPHPARPGIEEARVRGRAVQVWALIDTLNNTPGPDAADELAAA